MAARLPFNPRAMALLTGLSATTLAGYTTTSIVYAEEPPVSTKKSIYDDLPPPPPSDSKPTLSLPSLPSLGSLTGSSDPTPEPRPTPTVRLASQISSVRLYLHSEVTRAQRFLDTYFDKYLHIEHDVTTTVASLAPSKRSNETILPGAIFIAISAMAGSVLARRRFFLIRGLTPVITGTAAAWYFLPETTRNVADLAWKWEQKVPQVAETHLKVRDGVEEGWRTVKGGYDQAIGTVEDTTSKARNTIESWVRNSK